MIRKLLEHAAVLAAVLLVAACGGNDDDHEPIVTTYATGLTSPARPGFRPRRPALRVAEAGTGGARACRHRRLPVDIKHLQPLGTAGYSGRVLRVLADGTKQTIADKLPSMTDAYGGNYGPHRCRLHRQHAVRADRTRRLLARHARDYRPFCASTPTARPPRWPISTPGSRHRPTSSRTATRRPPTRSLAGVPLDDRRRQLPVRGRDQPRPAAQGRSGDRRHREALRHVDRQCGTQPDRDGPQRRQLLRRDLRKDGGPAELAVFGPDFASYTRPFGR